MHFWKSNMLYRSVGCARSKRQCRTALLNQKTYRWMLVCVWTVYLRLTCGIWSLKYWERPKEHSNQPKHARGKPVLRPKITPKIEQVLDQNVDLSNIDQVPSKAHLSEKESQLYIFGDNEAVLKMMIKGRRPTMRHVSRTHRVGLDWLFDRINLDPKVQFKYVECKNQLSDILTKGSFTRDDWHNLLHLFIFMNDTTFSCSHLSNSHSFLSAGKQSDMSKRSQESSSLGSPMVKAKACCLVS